MNRKERRKLTQKDLNEAKEAMENDLASVLLSVWVKVLYDSEEVDYDHICKYVKNVVDEYNNIDDFNKYRDDVYEETGIGMVRTPN